MFNIKDSKLYVQIMEGIRDFFSLPKESTESDVHNALDGLKPLAEQLEEARNGTDQKFAEINERLASMESEITSLKAENKSKDERVAELQVQLTELEEQATAKDKSIEDLKIAHAKETKVLAGQIATLKAGKQHEQDEGGDPHEASKQSTNDKVYTLHEGALKDWLSRVKTTKHLKRSTMPIIEGGFNISSSELSNRITVQTESAVEIFNNVAVLQKDQYARQLGLYGEVILGSDLEARFMSFDTPRHLLGPRTACTIWTPKGGIRPNLESFPTCPVEYDGTQCPDVFYGTCFERFFGPGNAVRDFTGTQAGQKLFAAMLMRIYQGLGNSFFDLYNFANHPIITTVNFTGDFAVGVPEWEDYVDQMLDNGNGKNLCAGLITQLDALAASGEYPNLALDIPNADINYATNTYTGDITGLFDRIIAAAGPELQTAINSGSMVNGVTRFPIFLATPAEFLAYEQFIMSMAPTNVLAYRYMIELNDGTTKLMQNVLSYKNMPVVRWDANVTFDAVTGAQSHRVALVAPGVFGVLHDVSNLRQWEGMGLIIEQSKILRDKGRIDMTTTFRWGAAIADPRFVVMASKVYLPA